MAHLSADVREVLENEIRDRFEDAHVMWDRVLESPHYPPIMSLARRGAWSAVGSLLQEIWEGTDR